MDGCGIQEKRAEGKIAIILGFAVLFAYLLLVALSWTIPVFVESMQKAAETFGMSPAWRLRPLASPNR
jgi:hypothetical protein